MPTNKLLGVQLTLLGMCIMIDLENEKIVLEIKELVAGIDSVKEEVNVYCDLMRQIFLSGSNKN